LATFLALYHKAIIVDVACSVLLDDLAKISLAYRG